MHPTKAVLAFALIALAAASCSREATSGGPDPDSGAARSARDASRELEARLEAEVGRRFRGPHLRTYLMLPDSFVGGSFPAQVAVLLREVEELECDHVRHLETSGVLDLRVLDAHQAFEEFAGLAAELYELMASEPGSIRSLRTGLEISDEALNERYDRGVDEVNAARDRFDAAIRALPAERQASFSRMGLTVRLGT